MSAFYKLSDNSAQKTKSLFVRVSDVNFKLTNELDQKQSQVQKTRVFVPVIKMETSHRLVGKNCHTVYLKFDNEEQRDQKMEAIEQHFKVLGIHKKDD
jgi:DNA/RNA endonuclease YhcR with UshA esterase domain